MTATVDSLSKPDFCYQQRRATVNQDRDAADQQFQIAAEASIFAKRMSDDGYVDAGDGTAWVETPTGIVRVPNN
ncbi:hypothetical protein [Kutzneria buriramensis]|uniref:hypothetical protein n=1 Tax=Kutzneria buriramensis TaxID=1045776 RepID=UPI0011C116C7|nr:hypothetical protein [Kutzneria buriramensis]